VSWEDFREYLEGMPCLVIVVMDTCHSGAIRLSGFRGEDPSAQLEQAIAEALQQLAASKSGLVVMAACLSEEAAREPTELAHGVLSLALLEGITGKRLYTAKSATPLPQEKPGAAVVTLEDLADYARARVKELVGRGQAVTIQATENIRLDHIPITAVRRTTGP
jgi:uncharacterized caspase-like protein